MAQTILQQAEARFSINWRIVCSYSNVLKLILNIQLFNQINIYNSTTVFEAFPNVLDLFQKRQSVTPFRHRRDPSFRKNWRCLPERWTSLWSPTSSTQHSRSCQYCPVPVTNRLNLAKTCHSRSGVGLPGNSPVKKYFLLYWFSTTQASNATVISPQIYAFYL